MVSAPTRAREAGFTYLLVLAAVIVLGIVAGVTQTTSHYQLKRDREAELLFRGQAFRQAIKSYYLAAEPKMFPRRLDDLLNDPRFPRKHHLRQLYSDPMDRGGNTPWLLIQAADGGIAGVVSASDAVPLKKHGFSSDLAKFEGAETYRDWIFYYDPPR